MGTGVVTATGNLVSDAIGKDKRDQITSLLNVCMLIGTFLGLVFAALMFAMGSFLRFIDTSALLQQGIMIKPWLESGFDHFVRVTIGLPE